MHQTSHEGRSVTHGAIKSRKKCNHKGQKEWTVYETLMSLVVAQDQDVEEGYMSPRQQVEEESLVLLLDLLIYPSFLSGVLLRVRLFLLFWMITMMPGDADLHQVIFYLSGQLCGGGGRR